MNKTTLFSVVILLFIVLLVIIKNNKVENTKIVLKETSVILAFGDSLTYGFGADSESSYPKQIENKTGIKVINAGVNGELSSEGLVRLPLLLKHKPDLVILCHGGNDILNHLSSSQLKNNLLAMINMIKKSGAKILLVGVPDFSVFSFDILEIYKELEDEADVVVEKNVLKNILLDRSLKSDYVHPNEKGYEQMADAFIEILEIQEK